MNIKEIDKTAYLSWSDVEYACELLSRKILQSTPNTTYDAIVTIQRGGCIPGVLLSHILNISEFYSIGIRTTLSENIKSLRLDSPIITKEDSLQNIYNKRILVVDDVVNTGRTMQVLKETLEKFAPLVYKTSALVWDGSYADLCPVDYYALYTPDWVVFPWEKHSPYTGDIE